MLVQFPATLVGNAEIRHQGGGRLLTFRSETPLGTQGIQMVVTEEEAKSFPAPADATEEYVIAVGTKAALAGTGAEELTGLQNNLKTAEKESQDQKLQISSHEEELEDLGNELSTAKSALADAELQVSTLGAENSSLKSSVDALLQAQVDATAAATDQESSKDSSAETKTEDQSA